jgi:hypothetical protein
MTDIVEKLRDHARTGDGWTRPVAAEAADEIERLRADVTRCKESLEVWDTYAGDIIDDRNRLREALRWFIDNDETNQGDEPMPEFGGQSWNEINAYWIDGLNRARAALRESDA